eukprot:TRINITY_DN13801_c0_g1_i1.p1 TRINITY_DN13801_c0_g1~~TRINITY_DN13801_c0_g1_i1.p1  ORF type:complete len:277 (-),score=28.55 TRINITY_DN13801_c0_g1_i1:10-840(-)
MNHPNINDANTPTTVQTQIILPGQTITTDTDYMRGHGTYETNEELIGSVAGVVERVNKLITVRPLNSRYNGDVGDIVVGRVTEVSQSRWKVDINTRQDAVLHLSSINMRGGIRRRTVADRLQMREYFVEQDLIVCEVAKFYDEQISLQIRKGHGKLANGLFISVSPALIKRCPSHIQRLTCGVTVFLGNNGYIWITEPTEEDQELMDLDEQPKKVIALELRQKIVRVRNCIMALAKKFLAIYPEVIMLVYKASRSYDVKQLLEPLVIDQITKVIPR